MECFCETNKTSMLKLEGDLGADPIWCDVCHCNLELEDVPVSPGLRKALRQWISQYGDWIDWHKDQLLPNGVDKEKAHNESGQSLSKKVQAELEGLYSVRFSASSMAKMYAH